MNTQQVVSIKPFKSIGHALSYYNECNPCRARSINLFEPERCVKPDFADFSGLSPRDKWAAVCLGVKEVLASYTHEEQQIFALRNYGTRTHQGSVEEIAEYMGLKVRHVYKVLRDIKDDLETEFRYRELIPDDDED